MAAPPDPPCGEGAYAEDEQGIQHAVDQPGHRHHQAGGLGIAGSPDGGIAHHGQHQHGDGQIPDQHVVVDEGDQLIAGAEQPEQRVYGQRPRQGDEGDQQHGQKQVVGGDAGGFIMLALAERMTHHRREAGPQSHRQRGDHEGHRKGEADGGQRLGAQHADEEGVDQVEGENGDDAEDHRTRHAQQYGRHGGSQQGIGSGHGLVSVRLAEFWLRAAQTGFLTGTSGDPSKTFIVRENIFFVFALEGLTNVPHIGDISNLARNGHSSKQHRDSFWESYR